MSLSTDAILGYGIAWEEEISDKDYDKFYVLEKKLEPLNFEIGYHCSNVESMPYLAVKGTVQRAWRGAALKVDFEEPTFAYDFEKAVKLVKEFYPELGEGSEVGWFMVSYWG